MCFFSNKLWSIFFFGIWPSSKFVIEAPGLRYWIKAINSYLEGCLYWTAIVFNLEFVKKWLHSILDNFRSTARLWCHLQRILYNVKSYFLIPRAFLSPLFSMCICYDCRIFDLINRNPKKVFFYRNFYSFLRKCSYLKNEEIIFDWKFFATFWNVLNFFGGKKRRLFHLS